MTMTLSLCEFLSSIGDEVLDADEESFLLFSLDIPSNNLGFCDSRASTINLTIHDRDYTIHQSPTLLSSNREGGTTGAVLWKITPLFAEWISSPTFNPFWQPPTRILTSSASVIELGCGISGLVALTLAPLVGKYVATDQEYVRRLFRQNIEENTSSSSSSFSSLSTSTSAASTRKKKSVKSTRSIKNKATAADVDSNDSTNENSSSITTNNIKFIPLDWELDIPSNDVLHGTTASSTNSSPRERNKKQNHGFDLLISCDCIYNEALIPSFVRTCADICALRGSSSSSSPSSLSLSLSSRSKTGDDKPEQIDESRPTIAIIAQQQRSPDVFETWLRESMRFFRVWRLDTRVLATGDGGGLGEGSGYVVHALVLKGIV